ncbi:MAG: response regulator [Acidobacteriota bacterium]|nr:response regulator [Acidobacteriota bacterium]
MNILVAEDNAANRELLREALGMKGHSVTEAENGEEALARLEEFAPDMILLDIQMPKLDGYEVIRRIRLDERWQKLKVIALTAFAMRGEQEKALAAGFDGYVSEPITLSVLWAEIEKVKQSSDGMS